MTRAVTLANLVAEDILTVDNVTDRVGIGTTTPSAQFQVGTGVSVYGNSGIVSATKFYGDGSNLSGITGGASLSAGSGAQRVVVTSLTSGAMTSAATDAELTYNSGTNTLSATTFSGNLTGNASGLTGTPDITVGTITASGNVSVGGTLTYNDVTNIDSIGIITARSGVSIADSIFHTGDTNTSIRFPAADTFSVETAGSERLRIDSSGEVGIGTVLPGNALHVFKNGDGQTPVKFETSNATGKLRFYNDSNGWSIDSEGDLRFVGGRSGSGAPTSLHIKSSGTAIFKAGLAEKVNVKTQMAGANACPITSGNVILTTSNEAGNTYPDITGVHSVLVSGQSFSVTVALKVNGSGTINGFYIDGVGQTIKWSGGSAPSAGSSGHDVFTFTAMKTGSGTTDYTVFGAATNYA